LEIKNKKYTKSPPSQDTILIFIYCEGKEREPDYFKNFSELSSKIKLIIKPANQDGNNSPNGLWNRAKKEIIDSKIKLEPKDQMWFVIDTDEWGEQIVNLRQLCKKSKWYVAQSNPCFEVWLYYHFFKEKIDTPGLNWKEYLNKKKPGGFDSRKHYININNAITNARNNFVDGNIDIGTTEVFYLAEIIYSYVKNKLN